MRQPSPLSGLIVMCSPGCSVDFVVPIWKETSKCFWRVPTEGPPLSALVSPAPYWRGPATALVAE